MNVTTKSNGKVIITADNGMWLTQSGTNVEERGFYKRLSLVRGSNPDDWTEWTQAQVDAYQSGVDESNN